MVVNRMIKQKKVFVLDTNVPLHDSQCVYKFEEHDIIIPIQVIEELDAFKKGFETVNYNAREFLRFLDEKSIDKIFEDGISLGEGRGTIKIQLAQDFDGLIKKNLRIKNVDAEIINTARKLMLSKEYKDRQVVIVSKDVNLRLKAKALNILAQDFLAETVVDVQNLFVGATKTEVDDSFLDALFAKKIPIKLPHLKKYNLLENDSLVLKSKTKSALGVFKNEHVSLVRKDDFMPFSVHPKNSEQAFCMNYLLDKNIPLVTLEGPAGTGKTIIALACALQQICESDAVYEKLYYTRKTISLGNRTDGLLPGDILEKINPFMNAMDDNLGVISAINDKNKETIDELKKNNKLKVEALSLIRGRSINKTFFLVDEAQNLTPHEVKTLVTRAGIGTKMVLIGDTQQIDDPYLDQKSNGLSYLIEKMKGHSLYAHMHLSKSVRSPLAELAGKIL